MKNTGRAPCLRTISLSFRAYSLKTPLSCGWTGHWLQSIMMATSNKRSSLLKTTTLPGANEYLPSAWGRKYDSTSCQSMPEPLMVTSVERCLKPGMPVAINWPTWLAMPLLK